MTNQIYQLIERPPTVVEHQTLWEAVGWGNVNIEVSAPSLTNSIYAVVIACNNQIIGMGRIVGDGAMYYYIQDVAILPEHQKQGLGKLIIDKLLAYISVHCVGSAFVGLFASHGNESFYQQFGFENHAPGMTGMFMVHDK